MEISYLAGFFDGEGCVSIAKNIDGYSPTIQITNSNLDVLKLIQNQFGGTIYQHREQRKRPPYYTKPHYMLRWCKRDDIIRVLEQLLPFLIVKKEKAELMLKFCCSRQKNLAHYTQYDHDMAKLVRIKREKRWRKLR